MALAIPFGQSHSRAFVSSSLFRRVPTRELAVKLGRSHVSMSNFQRAKGYSMFDIVDSAKVALSHVLAF